MAQHVIFLLHGMGTHGEGWSKGVQELLPGVYKRYPRAADFPFDKHFVFHELRYDQFFEDTRKRWRAESQPVLDRLAANGVDSSLIPKLAELGAAANEDKFASTHLLDVVFYFFISFLRIAIRTDLAAVQIPARLENDGQGNEVAEWSIICHSLGTIVAHDALHAMFTPTNEVRLNRRNRGPQCGLFVSNVGRLLQREFDVYESMVRPSVGRTTGIFDYYLNARHMLDPFPTPRPFDPPASWLDSVTGVANPARYQSLGISEVVKPNVHSLEHYLENPQVHIPLFRALWRRRNFITAQEEVDAIRDFRASMPIDAKLRGVEAELRRLVEREGGDFTALLDAATQFKQVLDAAQ
jgi:hypothetical protein